MTKIEMWCCWRYNNKNLVAVVVVVIVMVEEGKQ